MAGLPEAFSQTHAHFTKLVNKYEPQLRKRAQNIVQRSSLLQSPDEDDIYALAIMKVWKANFTPNASQSYEYRSDQEDKALFAKALECAAIDVIRRKKRDSEVLALLSLDAQFDSSEESVGSHQDIIGTGSFCDLVDLEIDLEAAIENAVTDPVHKLVAYYLWERVDREQLSEYSDNYIRVTAHRIRKKILQYLDKRI